MAMDIKNMKSKDIIAWCLEHRETDWLKAKYAEKVAVKVYPQIEVDGKMVDDKSQEPTIKTRSLNFVEIKRDFINTFMPEARPAKKVQKKPTVADYIATLPSDADLTDEKVKEILGELFGEYEEE